MNLQRICLAVRPGEEAAYRDPGPGLVHLGFRFGPDGALLRHRRLEPVSGGLLGILGDLPEEAEPSVLAASALSAAEAAGAGILLDLEDPSPQSGALLSLLSEQLARRGLPLWVRPPLAVPGAGILCISQVTGGDFGLYLRDCLERWGDRVVLELIPLYQDFPLPGTDGGRTLSPAARDALLERCGPGYESPELLAHYLPYRDAEGRDRLFLYDTGETLEKKLRLGLELGISHALLPCGPLREFLPQLLADA